MWTYSSGFLFVLLFFVCPAIKGGGRSIQKMWEIKAVGLLTVVMLCSWRLYCIRRLKEFLRSRLRTVTLPLWQSTQPRWLTLPPRRWTERSGTSVFQTFSIAAFYKDSVAGCLSIRQSSWVTEQDGGLEMTENKCLESRCFYELWMQCFWALHSDHILTPFVTHTRCLLVNCIHVYILQCMFGDKSSVSSKQGSEELWPLRVWQFALPLWALPAVTSRAGETGVQFGLVSGIGCS